MKNLLKIILILNFLFMQNSYAVDKGVYVPSLSKSVLKLKFEVFGLQPGWVYDSSCSSVVVGTKPLTVLTAAHCLASVAPDNYNLGLPSVKIVLPEGNAVSGSIKLKDFETSSSYIKNVAEDIAILIFDKNVEGLIPLKIGKKGFKESIKICGFSSIGSTSTSKNALCAEKKLVNRLKFTNFYPQKYRQQDKRLFDTNKRKFVGTLKKINVSTENVFAVNRLVKGSYAAEEPMILVGDSGGPWLEKDENGDLKIVALTSFNLLFTLGSSREMVSVNEHPYAAFGVKLDTTEALEAFAKAIMLGADMSFAMNNVQISEGKNK